MEKFKWSQFILKTETEKEVIMLNTLNKAVVALPHDEVKKINYLLPEINLIDDKVNTVEFLIENEFLVKKELDEERAFMDSLINEYEQDTVLVIHILPTLQCNFSCKYCYQDGINRNDKLAPQDLVVLVDYIKVYISKNIITEINLVLHGGEPTINWEVVPNLLKEIRLLCIDNDIILYTSIVSNGYLLDDEKARLLSEYGWYRFQVTIDGPRDIHNQRRILKNGNGTYDIIINNIRNILQKGYLNSVELRVNYDISNSSYIEELIEDIAETFDPKSIYFSFGLVTQTLVSDASKYISDTEISTNKHIELYLSYIKKAHEMGFPISDSFVFGSLCIAKKKNSFLLSPDGKSYKCLSMVGRENDILSDWKSLEINYRTYFDTAKYKECFDKNCPLIPICHCDCSFDSLVKFNDSKIINCRLDTLIQINKGIIEVKYAE